MALRGAIFDCDGTLLDSMPMWTRTCVSLLERYGVRDALQVFQDHESLDMDKKCFWYHDHLGIGESGEALYRELWDMVAHAYRNEVKPYPGAREFLQGLAQRKVPCVIVSSTPTELLRLALAQHGLLDFFKKIVFVGDVGRGKEHPDCYVAAGEMLGAPRADTWVFEDAPFGVRSAARAGFPTVAITNDHDGRDMSFLNTWATLVSKGYEGLTVERLDAMQPRVLRALVVAGSPEPSSAALVAHEASECDYVVAADRGAGVLRQAGVVPDLYCGDSDSIDKDTAAWVEACGCATERHPVEKDDTDLGLAIACAQRRADELGSSLRLTVTCASGGRPDHALGVFGVLAHNACAAPRLVEDDFECRILSPVGIPTWELHGRVGATASVVALGAGAVASEQGMRWELDHAELRPLDDLGVSNRVVKQTARISCHAGTLAAFVLRE